MNIAVLHQWGIQAELAAGNRWRQLLRMVQQLAGRSSAREQHREVFSGSDAREWGNREAGRLLTDHGDSILRMAYSYLHNLSDAEDVLQDTLIQFIKTRPQFENAVHEKTWLLRVAINLSKNKLSYKKRRGAAQLDEELIAAGESDLRFVWEAVGSLPSKYGEVLHLFYQEGYSTAQIAELLAKKETTVRSLLHRAREKLKAVLMEDYDFEEPI